MDGVQLPQGHRASLLPSLLLSLLKELVYGETVYFLPLSP